MLRPIEDIRAARALRRERQLSMHEWLMSLRYPQHLAVWSWRDPAPFIYSLLRRAGVVDRASEPTRSSL
jgi:hypothetical protein